MIPEAFLMEAAKPVISSITHFHGDNICTSNCFNSKRKLLPLLIKRIPDLFVSYSVYFVPQKYVYPSDKVVRLDAHSGEDSIEAFSYYNHYLAGGSHEQSYHFKYDACKNELEKIKTVIKRKEETSVLIEGL
jgi:hypothetical protein